MITEETPNLVVKDLVLEATTSQCHVTGHF